MRGLSGKTLLLQIHLGSHFELFERFGSWFLAARERCNEDEVEQKSALASQYLNSVIYLLFYIENQHFRD